MKKFGLVLGLCVLAASLQATAATISSDSFTFALGKTSADFAWNGNENAATNSPATIGDFTYSPSATSDAFSGTGPTFGGMTLANGNPGNFSGYSNDFVLNITGSYAGTPGDNCKVNVEITNVSIYGVAYSGLSSGDFQFTETTPGHAASSPAVALNTVTAGDILALGGAANYNLLAWNPDDFDVDGTSFTRTFVLGGSAFAIDGLVVEGKVNLTYDAVPEPATLGLLILGGLGLLRRKMSV
jgi:hypothetical protein